MSGADEQRNDPRFEEALVEYLRRIDQGEQVDQAQFIAEHAEFADELREYFATADRIERIAASPEETLDSDKPPTVSSPPLDVVRYFGDYELLEEIGRGGMGVVYRARQVSLNRIVAVKMILAGQLANDDDVKRFQTEAEAAANLTHPGIVPIFEVGLHERQHYFSMGFIDGESLARKVAEGPLPPREAAQIIEQVARAVAYAHEHGVIHRDLKPGNVLVDRDGRPHIADFGLAKRIEDDSTLTKTGQIVGTPSYMSPEQASGNLDEIGPATDVYSLGAILYASLVGRPPFHSANVGDTLNQVQTQDPVSPRQLNADVPRDLETICLKCLQKDPRGRYVTAQQLLDEVGRYLAGVPIHARPVSWPQRALRWARRRPTVAGMIVSSVVAALALVGIVVSLVYQKELEKSQQETAKANEALTRTNQQVESANRKLDEARQAEVDAKIQLDQILCFRRVGLALSEWKNDNAARARTLLRDCPESLRGWEWHYANAVCHPDTLVLEFQDRNPGVQALAFTDREPRAVTSTRVQVDEHMVRIVDVRSGETIQTLKDQHDSHVCAAFNPSGTKVVTGTWGGALTIWDVESGEVIRSLKDDAESVQRVVFAEDRICVLTGGYYDSSVPGLRGYLGKTTLKVIDAETEESLFEILARDGVISPNGTLVAIGSTIWDVESGREVRTISPLGSISTATFSPDDKLLALAIGRPVRMPMIGRPHGPFGTVEVWDVDTGQRVWTLEESTQVVQDMAFSPDGKRIAVGRKDGSVGLWDVDTGKRLRVLLGHTRVTGCVVFSPDAKRIMSLSRGAVRVWDIEDDWAVPDVSRIHTFSSDGARLCYVEARQPHAFSEFQIRDTATGQVMQTLNAGDPSLYTVFSADGKRIAAATEAGTLVIWDVEDGRKVLTLHGPSEDIAGAVFSTAL